MAQDPYEVVFGAFRRDADRYSLPNNSITVPLPDPVPGYDRRPKRVEPQADDLTYIDIDEIAEVMWTAEAEYLSTPNPAPILLLKCPPASGKTRFAVQLAEDLAAKGKRVGYFGPRHNLMADLHEFAGQKDWWHEWQPHYSAANTHVPMCRHGPRIHLWMQLGHQSIDFCRQICGSAYIANQCLYHAQRRVTAPIIYGQHQHLAFGHPLMDKFSILIVDESPIMALAQPIAIPAEVIITSGQVQDVGAAHLLTQLALLAMKGECREGLALLDALGGARHVSALLANRSPAPHNPAPPLIRSPDETDHVPSLHVDALISLLLSEAQAALDGRDYNPRVAVLGKKIELRQPITIAAPLPPHVICLDATADPLWYKTVFDRPVQLVAPRVKPVGRISQISDAGYGIGMIRRPNRPNVLNTTVEQLRMTIDRICAMQGYTQAGVITHKKYEPAFKTYRTGHFYGERGSNRFEDVDALFVVGTPSVDWFQARNIAQVLFPDRQVPFKADKETWLLQDRRYRYKDENGDDWSLPIPGFWHDPDLQAVINQTREAELIQAVHRSRINRRPVDVWLFSNIPIDELPLTRLVSIKELLNIPDNVNLKIWLHVLDLADQHHRQGRPLCAADLKAELGTSPASAQKYLNQLIATQPDRWHIERLSRGGRPAQTLVPQLLGRLYARKEQHLPSLAKTEVLGCERSVIFEVVRTATYLPARRSCT